MPKEIVRIGLFSRIDAGSKGYRRGLVIAGFEIFNEEKTHFNILLGGLVSKRAVSQYLRNKVKTLKDEAAKNAQETGEKPQKIDRKKIEQDYLDELTKELAAVLPKSGTGKEKMPRLYIMTSPSYDGDYGKTVAEKLTKLRPDIRYWEKADEHFPLKRINKRLLGLVPEKESWRSEYDSTPVDREVKDHQKRTTKPLPDIYSIGCFASSFYKPAGEAKRSYLSIPALHKLEEVKTSENQIGVSILTVYPEGEFIKESKRTYNLKDLVSRERELIPIPPHCSENQVKILTALREKGSLTVGLFDDATGISREALTSALKRIIDSEKFQPKIYLDKASGRYDFDLEWIQKNLTYPSLDKAKWQEDVLAAFGCLHAGSVHTNYDFFINQLPSVILEIGAKIFVGDGDLIEGLKHNLIERGEVFGGLGYTSQEKLAAHLVAEVMLRVFDARLQKARKSFDKNAPSGEALDGLIKDNLLTFIYREGNHDQWVEDLGVDPLTTFRYELVRSLTLAIADTLQKHGLSTLKLNEIVENKVIKTEIHTLPSGINLEMLHLHMARAKTTTLRLQESLSKSNCQVLFLANFHVAASMNRWDPEVGQRVGMQLGTIVRETDFEDNKGKKVDTGVGCLRILSQAGKIMMSEEFYVSPPDGDSFDAKEILELLEKKIGTRFHGSQS